MRKKRILFCSEATYLNTGYATYYREVIKRLYLTGKYEIAELASYGDNRDPKVAQIPWVFFGNLPDKTDEKQKELYDSKMTNQFGEWKFEEALLTFQPDIVVDIRDFWMLEFEERSPFRKLFHWAIMPTVDATPQNEQWISTFANADGVFNYSDWGVEILKKESNGKINCLGSAPPSADDAYKPVEDKMAHKDRFGIDPKMKIIGTVMRNQKRKLFPDLFEAYRKFLDLSKRNDVYLYCHTSFPDLGWDIPKLLLRYGISSKVLFTYVCENCKHAFPAFFSDARRKCGECKGSAFLSNVHNGVSNEFLSKIVNCFDLYIQYANSEGFGLPQVEAAACGIPIMSIDYSAMSSVIRKLGGTPLKVKSLHNEMETGCLRAVPDNTYAAKKMKEFFNLSKEEIRLNGKMTRQNFLKYYQWDETAKKWEDYFDGVDIRNEIETWGSPLNVHEPSTSFPPNLSDREYAQWLIKNVLGDESRLNTYMEARLIRDLSYGIYVEGVGDLYFNEDSHRMIQPDFQKFDREIAYNIMLELCENRNRWEKIRYENIVRGSL
ncbi:hypothetical protein CL634_02190 [bacterium]|nr:hypothetical protein [bacterium]